jgi:hypothetical protein
VGEYQYYNQTLNGQPDRFFHTGVDIMGRGYRLGAPHYDGYQGDIIRLVTDGWIWFTSGIATDGCQVSTSCRAFVSDAASPDAAKYIYYYSHLYFNPAETYTSSTVRDQLLNASDATNNLDNIPMAPNTQVAEGDVLCRLTRYEWQSNFWEHLHFSIIHAEGNYDIVNPLTGLKNDTIFDEKGPVVEEIAFRNDEDSTGSFLALGACPEITGTVDILAKMRDSFNRSISIPGSDSVGVYRADYSVTRMADNSVVKSGTWYEFDRVPVSCAGPDRGSSCPFPTDRINTPFEFIQSLSDGFGVRAGKGDFVTNLYWVEQSSSIGFTQDSGEYCWSVLTNEWGLTHITHPTLGVQDFWNTGADGDGRYQVTVNAWDEAGNMGGKAMYVYVHNDQSTPLELLPDVYVRDNDLDNGTLPSTLNGQPFWVSPDIIVIGAGEPRPWVTNEEWKPGETVLTAGLPHEVFVRIFNNGCVDAQDVKVRVYSANPKSILNDDDWVPITLPENDFIGHPDPNVGIDVPAGGQAVIGPFSYVPTPAEVVSNNGHRCLLAELHADPDDPYVDGVTVENSNNRAQRNIQVNGMPFFYILNPGDVPAEVAMSFRCNDFPVYDDLSVVELVTEYHLGLANAWQGVPHTELTVDPTANELRLRFRRCNVDLPPATFGPWELVSASVELKLPPTTAGTYTVDFYELVDSVVRGGMSFYAVGYIVR